MYKKKLRKLKIAENLDDKIEFCIHGYDFLTGMNSGFDKHNMTPIKEFYDKYSGLIYERWRYYHHPGCRPWIWWQLEANGVETLPDELLEDWEVEVLSKLPDGIRASELDFGEIFKE